MREYKVDPSWRDFTSSVWWAVSMEFVATRLYRKYVRVRRSVRASGSVYIWWLELVDTRICVVCIYIHIIYIHVRRVTCSTLSKQTRLYILTRIFSSSESSDISPSFWSWNHDVTYDLMWLSFRRIVHISLGLLLVNRSSHKKVGTDIISEVISCFKAVEKLIGINFDQFSSTRNHIGLFHLIDKKHCHVKWYCLKFVALYVDRSNTWET